MQAAGPAGSRTSPQPTASWRIFEEPSETSTNQKEQRLNLYIETAAFWTTARTRNCPKKLRAARVNAGQRRERETVQRE